MRSINWPLRRAWGQSLRNFLSRLLQGTNADRDQRARSRLVLSLAVLLHCSPCQSENYRPETLRLEAFEAAQRATSSDAAGAIAKVAARFAKGDGPLAILVGEHERLATQRSLLESQLERLYATNDIAATELRKKVRTDYDVVSGKLAASDARMAREFPEYAELTSPRPLSLTELQALLRPDEALVLVLVNEEASYVWGVTRESVAWSRSSELGAPRVDKMVSNLRRYLSSAGRAGTFDRDAAYELYAGLIMPIEAEFSGKTVFLVTSGSLSTLPFGVLLTQAPEHANPDPQKAPWLADKYALASLPSVSNLRALRCLMPNQSPAPGCSATAKKPFARGKAPRPFTLVGFGAPAGLRQTGVSAGRGVVSVDDSSIPRHLANPARLRELDELPGAGRELDALKTRYPSAIVKVGSDATETAVKLTYKVEIAQARYVVFSTHGLLAGQLGMPEPGLVLTPPGQATETDDGYLAASEAAGLRLTADLVVLSACNTAAADGTPLGEGLSGLARSFFYAGAKSLLVSHWEIADDATAELVTSTFQTLESDELQQKARALQGALQRVRANVKWSDPSVWGAFALVGEVAG